MGTIVAATMVPMGRVNSDKSVVFGYYIDKITF